MSRIRILSDPLVSQIAAGEVVERPSSVVKELVENALDAGASSVRLELEAGGKRRIAVADDGCGMDRDDALLAFDRHATSKIASFDDLQRVGTLGFRGEALASIAAVSRVELSTALESGAGQRVRLEGGRVLAAEPAARARGTTVEVASLFWNVPARRKFLKATATELRRCLEVVQGYALARPEVRWTVLHEGRTLLEALPAGPDSTGARERIGQIFGASFAEHLAVVPGASAAAGERIGGFVGGAETARSRRRFVFVNRRLVHDRTLMAAFYRAVREQWRSDDSPALFLLLEVAPTEVDVNVHPQKTEVRFRDLGFVERVAAALRAGLAAARGEEPAPLRTPARPPSEPLAWQGLGERRAPGPWPPAAEAYEVREAGGPEAGEQEKGWPAPVWNEGEELEVREVPSRAYGEGEPGPRPRSAWTGGAYGEPSAVPLPPSRLPAGGLPSGRLAGATYPPPARASVPLTGRSGEPRPFRLLGQYKGTLILLEGPDGLYLIDQHVAHERILYERLRRSLERERPASQALLHPVLLDLAPAERLQLAEVAPRLEGLGFGVGELSGGTLALTAVPAVLSAEEGERLLLAVASAGLDGGDEPAALRRSLLEGLAASLACKAAVKMHHPLKPEEMEALVAELFAAEEPYACPHGRPIVLSMPDADLERRFGRR